ncbi:MAG: CARDB domain-containing protein [Gaiella sp.]
MSARDDDILDFDFDFGDEVTREAPVRGGSSGGSSGSGTGGASGGGGPSRPRLRAPRAGAPLLRLVGLVAFAILLIVLLAVWAQGCAEDDKQSSFDDYYAEIGAVGADSAKIGDDLATLLTTPGLQQAELETKLTGLVQQQQLDVERAQAIDPPGPLTPAQSYAVQALELRVGGLQGMLDTFKATKDSDDAGAAGQRLAVQGQRLEASDVVWRDLFQTGADAVAADEGVDGAAPPSVFVENAELYSPRSMSAIWNRIHGASTGGTPSGLHGSQLAYTRAVPSGVQLSTDAETTITVSTDLGFEVAVTNSGESQEVQVEVSLTIPKQPSPIVKKGTIDIIDPGETKTVLFTDFPDVPFGEGTTIQVSVKPVPGETNTANNSAEYPVVFTLTPTS